MNEVLAHYDRFPSLIDAFGDWPYREARAAAIEELHLQPGDRVVDLFCGTGVNFEPLHDRVGPTGRIVGVDGPAGMLRRARRRIQRRKLDAERIEMRRIDIAEDRDDLRALLGGSSKLLITLALGCFPDYDAVYGDIHEMLPQGARVAYMEGPYFEKRSLACRVVDWIGAADCTRRTWEPLEKRLADFRRVDYPLHFSTLVVASGTKR
jgi:demethylmenaquinone methyltransferase/2-methoxy-6-polyprenyl-1,4-benzoquinol methylase